MLALMAPQQTASDKSRLVLTGSGFRRCTSSRPVLVVTTSMSELLSSSVTVSSSSVGVDDLNWKGVLAPLMSPACVT